MEKDVEFIKNKKNIIAIIIPKDFFASKSIFFTPENFPQQLGLICYKKGERIQAHIHNRIKREVFDTQETLIIKKGKVKVNFYDPDKNYLKSKTLNEGDIIFLASGGHEFKFLEDSQMVEVKQGPYLKEKDKIRFKGVEQ